MMTHTRALCRARALFSTRSAWGAMEKMPHLACQEFLQPVSKKYPCRAFSTAQVFHEDAKSFHKLDHNSHPPEIIRNGAAIKVHFEQNANGSEESVLATSIYHASWLWFSDPTYIHPSSGQRTRRLGQYPDWKIHKAEKIDLETALTEETSSCVFPNPAPPPGVLHSVGTMFDDESSSSSSQETSLEQHQDSATILLKVTWDTSDDKSATSNKTLVSYYDWNWLQRCRYDDDARRDRAQKTQITRHNALGMHPTCRPIEEVNYYDLFPSEEAEYTTARKDTLLRILHAIAEQGAVLIRDAPLGSFLHYAPKHANDDNDDYTASVAKVGRALSGGALSHGALYGELFHVRSMPQALNIAYTTVALSPHQDLAYFESKPGMQLLHCIRNHQDQIRGGESLLIDAIAAAESLREIEPRYFETLCRSYATFMKQREGADMVFQRPHIVLGDIGQVVAVHWSPPFEAPPLAIPADRMEEYLEAYAAFERMLDDNLFSSPSQNSALLPSPMDAQLYQYAKDYTWKKSLEPGDMLVFNNQRMLHGRRGFEALKEEGEVGSETVHRHLAGCYTNIDDTINTYRVLLRNLPDRGDRIVKCFGNGSGGSL